MAVCGFCKFFDWDDFSCLLADVPLDPCDGACDNYIFVSDFFYPADADNK